MNKLDLNRRQIGLMSALFLTIAATAYVRVNDAETQAMQVVEPSKPAVLKGATSRVEKTPVMADKWMLRELAIVSNDIFSVKNPSLQEGANPKENMEFDSKKTKPQPQVMVMPEEELPPPPPKEPVLPFRYIGKLGEDGQYTVFIAIQNKNYAVKVGDVVAENYRIEKIRPPIMMVTYLPKNISQTMQIGEGD